MSKHTPEPWYDEVSHISGGTPGACEVVPIYGDDNNRARVVQCVNACTGMADPAAEIAALRRAVEVLGQHQSSTSRLASAEAEYADAKEAAEDDSILDELSENIDAAMKRFNETLADVNNNPLAAAAVRGEA